MKLVKNGQIWDINDPMQIKAFMASGWAEDNNTAQPESNFSEMSNDELIEYAKQKGLDTSKVKNREQLLKLIEEAANGVQK